jgi:hypothetical protein
VFGVGDRRVDALLHVVSHPLILDVLDAVDEVLVHVARHLRHGDVGTRPLGELCEGGGLEPPFGPVEIRERRSEMHHQQVRLVSEDREDGGLARLGILEIDVGPKVVDALLERPVALPFGGRPPAIPVDPPEIV